MIDDMNEKSIDANKNRKARIYDGFIYATNLFNVNCVIYDILCKTKSCKLLVM